MIELAVFIVIPLGLVAGGIAWLLARYRPGWSRLLIVPLASLPLPLAILVCGIGAMVYGWELPGETCGLDECGGYMILGVLGIALSVCALVVTIPAAIIGAVIARRDGTTAAALPEERFK